MMRLVTIRCYPGRFGTETYSPARFAFCLDILSQKLWTISLCSEDAENRRRIHIEE